MLLHISIEIFHLDEKLNQDQLRIRKSLVLDEVFEVTVRIFSLCCMAWHLNWTINSSKQILISSKFSCISMRNFIALNERLSQKPSSL